MIKPQLLLDITKFQDHPDTQIHKAAYDGNGTKLRESLRDKNLLAKINCRNNLGCTPLRLAASEGHEDAVRCLVHHGAEIDLCDVKAQTPLYVAVKKRHENCIKALLELGANPDGDSNSINTPAYLAAMDGHLDILKILIKYGADLENAKAQNKRPYMSTPLYISLVYQQLDCFDILLRAGAKCDSHNSICEQNSKAQEDPQYLYHLCVKNNTSTSVPQKLYEYGANVYLRDKKGRLAHELAENESSRYIQTLYGQPRNLLSRCRNAIRSIMGRMRLHKIDTLPLPPRLQLFLKHE